MHFAPSWGKWSARIGIWREVVQSVQLRRKLAGDPNSLGVPIAQSQAVNFILNAFGFEVLSPNSKQEKKKSRQVFSCRSLHYPTRREFLSENSCSWHMTSAGRGKLVSSSPDSDKGRWGEGGQTQLLKKPVYHNWDFLRLIPYCLSPKASSAVLSPDAFG